MKFYKKFIVLVLLFSILLPAIGCKLLAKEKQKTSVDSSVSSLSSAPKREIINANNSVENYVEKFYRAIKDQDSNLFKSISSEDGIIFVRVFLSGAGTRGTDFNETISLNKIPKKLVFSFYENESTISLKDEFETKFNIYSQMKKVKSNEFFSTQMIRPDIISLCYKIVGDENDLGEETRIYLLKNGQFCIAQFANSGLQYSRWVVFNKIKNQYRLKFLIIID